MNDLNDLIERIASELKWHGYGTDEFQLLTDCRAEITRLLLANETLTALNAEYAERVKALEAKGEPVCYITQAALDALKRGASSSVRVWRKPDERLNGDVALYTKENC